VAGRGGQSKKGEGREIREFVVRLASLGWMRYLQQIQGGQQIVSRGKIIRRENLWASLNLREKSVSSNFEFRRDAFALPAETLVKSRVKTTLTTARTK
jgi:hypothetical protein